MKGAFITVFFVAVILMMISIILSFLLLIKVLLVFFPEINIFDISMTYEMI
jgi:hypothetical protein